MSEPLPPTESASQESGTPNVDHDRSTIALMTNQFGALLEAVKELNVTMGAQKTTMEGVKSTLIEHGAKFDVLIKDALKNDQPYDEKALDDESTCLALYDIVMAKTKEKAEEWNGTIDVTLIFIALFSAVLTAFLVPATQALLPNFSDSETSGNSTSTSSQGPPLPPKSAEAVCALYHLSLITAIIIAVLCALGRQWVRKLTTKPKLNSWRERTLWHMHRMKRAEGWLRALMEVLYWFLLLSIGLFMSAILYQLWNLSTSFEERATILVATWGVGVVLVSGIAVTMVGTTYHAVRYEASVFEGVVSRAIIGDIDLGLVKGLKSGYRQIRKSISRGWRKIGGVALMERLKGGRKTTRQSLWIMREESRSTDKSSDTFSWRRRRRAAEALRKTFDWMKTFRIKVNRHSEDELMNAYYELLADTSDPILLERAAASFCYRDWVLYGEGSIDQLKKALDRLMATDTSFRVRETVNAQFSRFSTWIPVRRREIEEKREFRAYADRWAREGDEFFMARSKTREEEAKKDEEEERRTIQLTNFLLSQRKDKISPSFTPTWENCADILDLLSLPIDKFVAKCLCIDDHNNNLGKHHSIFHVSVEHCFRLLSANKFDDVTRIVSHVDLFPAVRSFVLAHSYDSRYDRVFRLIISDRRSDVLRFLTEFLSPPRDWSHVNPGNASSVFLIAAGFPPQFPSDLDLSPIIAHIARHPPWWNWREASEALIACLGQCNISTLSDPASVYYFLQQCVHLELSPPEWRPKDAIRRASSETRDAASILLHRHKAFFAPFIIPLPPSPPLTPSDNAISLNGHNSDLDFPLLSDSVDIPDAVPSLPIDTLDDSTTVITSVALDRPGLPSSSSTSHADIHHVINMTDTVL
ncbi:hypothetical protein SISNIDRAFT_491857 [Sistotremastrum niveocremeum HHB9708]|uniref:DUF6535 domain-containing protein n=1 Tax=Sistotremastrum niveocremeum HHB9708 TaxID=1314777 RepID=A0A164MB56_9AGAM|nr:hypothetical protein SISNIDRAFT_491857 [Sistotremastrum niveocremeum HHB9708]